MRQPEEAGVVQDSYNVSTLLCRTEVINVQSVHSPITFLPLCFNLYYRPFASLSSLRLFIYSSVDEIKILYLQFRIKLTLQKPFCIYSKFRRNDGNFKLLMLFLRVDLHVSLITAFYKERFFEYEPHRYCAN
jgi:hypothetical protein